jgi:lipid-A-disaccharide synthase
LPGSRHSEISRLLPVFLRTLGQLRQQVPFLHGVIPTVPHLERDVRRMVEGTQNISIIVDVEHKKDAFAASNVAIAASGTVALELAIAGVPSVIGYMVNAATAVLARRLVRTPYASLVNILLAREVMPERLQERCTPDELCAELIPLLSGGPEREQQLAAFGQVRGQLSLPGKMPNDVAAREVLRIIGPNS